MKPIERILRINKYLLFSIFLLCSCHPSTGKDTSLTGKSNDTNNVTPKNNATQTIISNRDTILINDMKFIPGVIKVNKGDTVVWINKDMVVHNVTELSGKGWASPSINPGATWKIVVLQPAYYNCSIHPVMKGKIMIK